MRKHPNWPRPPGAERAGCATRAATFDMAGDEQPSVTSWMVIAASRLPEEIEEEASRVMAQAIHRHHRWHMIEPTLMAAKALLLLWDQQASAVRQPQLAAQFTSARPGQYAGGHEIMIEVLLWADKLGPGAQLLETQLEDLRCLVTQALDIGSGTGIAMQELQTRVQNSIAVLTELGHGPAFQQVIAALHLLSRRVREEGKLLAAVSCTAVAHSRHGRTALRRLREVQLAIDRTSHLAPSTDAAPKWCTIHLHLRARLLEIGIDPSPNRLMELQLRGNPSHLVQVLFQCGRIAVEQFHWR